MTEYAAIDRGDTLLTMEADCPDSVPTNLHSEQPQLEQYAKSLVSKGFTARQVASRMGPYATLNDTSENPVPPPTQRERSMAILDKFRQRAKGVKKEDIDLSAERTQRRGEEPSWVHDEVVDRTGLSRSFVIEAIRDLHHVVDRWVTGGFCIFAPPLFAHRKDDPVFEAIVERWNDPEWRKPDDLPWMDNAALAVTFGLDEELFTRYPVAWRRNLLWDLEELRELDEDDPGVDDLEKVLNQWLDTFGDDRPGKRHRYEFSTVGFERDFEDWLIEHLDVLGKFGYPVGFHARQWRNSGGVADMVCRFTEDSDFANKGDWLIIENKATMVDADAVDQLERYMAAAATELAVGDAQVFGLLLADGVTVAAQERQSSTTDYISLTLLGYRDVLHLVAPS